MKATLWVPRYCKTKWPINTRQARKTTIPAYIQKCQYLQQKIEELARKKQKFKQIFAPVFVLPPPTTSLV